MTQILAPSFLNTPWGMAFFLVLDIAVFVLIAALNYRWLFKRLFDILFSAIFLAVFLVFFLAFLAVDAIYNKVTNSYRSLFEIKHYCGKKEKPIRIAVLATERVLHDEAGNLLPEKERVTGFGKFLKGSGLKYYPMLAYVFTGRMSFVGPVPMTLSDAAALPPEHKARFAVRPGIVSSLSRYGGEKLTYADMFEEDEHYAAHVNLFRDISFFMTRIAQKVRGERVNNLGEVANKSYLAVRLEEGTLTEEEAEAFIADAKAKEARKSAAASERRLFEERNLFR